MMKKILIVLLLVVFVMYLSSCASQQSAAQSKPSPQKVLDIDTKVEQQATTPQAPKQEISPEVKELLDKSKGRAKSIYYKYKGPETTTAGDNFFEFYAKGAKIKYKPALLVKSLDREDSYDSIFIDKDAKTAQSYCIAAYCAYKGKKQDLNYDSAYISTIFDWVDGLASAKKVGEEVIDDRTTWKVETSRGIMWIDTFYGVPLKIDSNGKNYRFQQISANSVADADVNPILG